MRCDPEREKRWFAFYGYRVRTVPAVPPARDRYGRELPGTGSPARTDYQHVASRGPFLLSDWDADKKQRELKNYITGEQSSSAPSTWGTGRTEPVSIQMFRLVYSPAKQLWIWDLRTPSDTLACVTPESRPTVAGTIGASPVSPPLRGRWPGMSFPLEVAVNGRRFRRAEWSWPYPGVRAQYREAVPRSSMHLFVLQDWTWVVPHVDEANPDQGSLLAHGIRDLLLRRQPPPL